ncbi:MAG: hypothetical protein KC636_17775, partial [Myxococcales bacterium]|nr:hypothetical protein [Myxococcales bacterium]
MTGIGREWLCAWLLGVWGPPAAPTSTPVAAPTWTLAWSAPAECPDAARVRDEVTRMLGGAVDLGDRSLHAEAAVTAVDAGWRLDLRLTGSHAEGARAIESASCEELADAAALVIAIAIDPERMMTAASATPPPDV